MNRKKKLGEILLASGLLDLEQLHEGMAAAAELGSRLGQLLIQRGIVTESQLAAALSEQLRIERYNPQQDIPDIRLSAVIPSETAHRHQIAPLTRRGQIIRVAVTDPTDIEALDAVEGLSGLEAQPVVCTLAEWRGLTHDLYERTSTTRQAADPTPSETAAGRLAGYFKVLDFKREPFSSSPDPDFFCLSREHSACLRKIELALRLHRGLTVIVGDVGTGKTTLCRHLIRKMSTSKRLETHLILDPYYSNPEEFLSALARMFGLPDRLGPDTEETPLEAIRGYLLTRHEQDERMVALIIDEAQELPEFCLGILRELLAFEGDGRKLLQVVIFGQLEFDRILQADSSFADCVDLHHELRPLSFRETRRLIRFRLERAGDGGARRALFTLPAFWKIHRATRGYPRKIITLCHRVILTMIIRNRPRADWALVRSCIRGMVPARRRHWPWVVATAVLVLLAAVGWVVWTQPSLLGLPRLEEPPAGVPDTDVAAAEGGLLVEPVPARPTPDSGTAYAVVPIPEGTREPPPATIPPPALQRPDASPEPPAAILDAMRGARHPEYGRIVFQFTADFAFDQPRVEGRQALLRFQRVATNLPSLQRFTALGAAVQLEPEGEDLLARVELPADFERLKVSTLPNPFRIVLDLHTSAVRPRGRSVRSGRALALGPLAAVSKIKRR